MVRSFFRFLALSTAVAAGAGCGHSADSSSSSTNQQWSTLIQDNWSLAGGTEDPRWCKRVVLAEDTYISAIRPIHPPGTHHTTLGLVADDGSTTCSALFASGLIYAAGVGTGELHMPDGVAMKLPAGKVLILGLHIYNTTNDTLTGLSGIEVVRARPEDVQQEADLLISGPINFSLLPNQETTITHSCALAGDQTLFALFPHMHQLGTHIKNGLTIGGADTVLHDADYVFTEQYQLPIGPIAMHAGDTVNTTCTFMNTRPNTVTFGESSDTEMCFSVLFRYPASGSGFCVGSSEVDGNMMRGDAGAGMPSGPPCAAMDAPGNDKGVGKYCSSGGGQCAAGGTASLCIADYTTAAFGDFCTMMCTSDADCGAGAVCAPGSTRVCLPQSCLASPDGGSADGG